jgi:hypothetical protein
MRSLQQRPYGPTRHSTLNPSYWFTSHSQLSQTTRLQVIADSGGGEVRRAPLIQRDRLKKCESVRRRRNGPLIMALRLLLGNENGVSVWPADGPSCPTASLAGPPLQIGPYLASRRAQAPGREVRESGLPQIVIGRYPGLRREHGRRGGCAGPVIEGSGRVICRARSWLGFAVPGGEVSVQAGSDGCLGLGDGGVLRVDPGPDLGAVLGGVQAPRHLEVGVAGSRCGGSGRSGCGGGGSGMPSSARCCGDRYSYPGHGSSRVPVQAW